MTEAEKLEFLNDWLTDIGQTVRELRAAIQRLYDRVNRETDASDDRRREAEHER